MSVQMSLRNLARMKGGIARGTIPVLQRMIVTSSHQTLPIWRKPDIEHSIQMSTAQYVHVTSGWTTCSPFGLKTAEVK